MTKECTICGEPLIIDGELFCKFCKVNRIMNTNKVSSSLKNLLYVLSNTPKDVNAIDTGKCKIEPTQDVLKFIKITKNLNWNVVGYDNSDNPIFAKNIQIIRRKKDNFKSVKVIEKNFEEEKMSNKINEIKEEVKMFPNLYAQSLIDGLLIKLNYNDIEVIEFLTSLVKHKKSATELN